MCHQADYNGAKAPDHIAQALPADCTQCHNTKAWQPWTVNHDAQFRISNNHKSKVNLCNACHADPTNFATFSCLSGGCHKDAHHQKDACVPCHKG